jgi:hypothetical protein
MALENIDPRNRTEQRKFGIGLSVALLLLAGLRWWLADAHPALLVMLSATFFVVAVALPWALRPILAAWIKAVLAVNWVVTRFLLGIVFYGMIAPAGLLLRAVGDDPLKRRQDPEALTYWEDAEEQPEELEAYLGQSSGHVIGAMIALSVFLWNRKRFWLAPIIIALLLLSLLMILTGSAGIWSSFIYMGI